MNTILPKKAVYEKPIATDDEALLQLINDKTITQFPNNSSVDSFYLTSTQVQSQPQYINTTPQPILTNSAGFGESSGFNASTSFGGNTGFGAPTSGFGSNTVSSPPVNQPVLTGAGSNAAQGADVLVANDNADFINKKWRPLMAFVYMITCTCDFVVFPILWSLLQAMSHGQVTSQWQPLTLQGAGLYHIAMGAVLGVAAYGRTKEKLEGKQ